MKEHIKYFNKYTSPIWCYVMMWAAMDRWGEEMSLMDIIYGTRRGEI